MVRVRNPFKLGDEVVLPDLSLGKVVSLSVPGRFNQHNCKSILVRDLLGMEKIYPITQLQFRNENLVTHNTLRTTELRFYRTLKKYLVVRVLDLCRSIPALTAILSVTEDLPIFELVRTLKSTLESDYQFVLTQQSFNDAPLFDDQIVGRIEELMDEYFQELEGYNYLVHLRALQERQQICVHDFKRFLTTTSLYRIVNSNLETFAGWAKEKGLVLQQTMTIDWLAVSQVLAELVEKMRDEYFQIDQSFVYILLGQYRQLWLEYQPLDPPVPIFEYTCLVNYQREQVLFFFEEHLLEHHYFYQEQMMLELKELIAQEFSTQFQEYFTIIREAALSRRQLSETNQRALLLMAQYSDCSICFQVCSGPAGCHQCLNFICGACFDQLIGNGCVYCRSTRELFF